MTTMAVEVLERADMGTVFKIARKELKGTIGSRWFWMWVVAFVGLAAVLVMIALPSSSINGHAGFGRTAASLVTLVQIIIPLMGLALGALSIAGQRESGAMRFLMSHPISRTEAFWGIYLGHVAALGIAAGAGFGIAGVLTATRGVSGGTGPFVWIALVSWVLAVAMLGIGMLISTYAARSGAALGIAVFVWLFFVFIGDLGLMGTSAATSMPVSVLFGIALLNPVEAFRLTALTALSGSLDALGPAGIFAVDTLGDSLGIALFIVLVLWLAVPALVAWRRFVGKADL
ncbi:MAG: ABC transporter permease subunit [Actinomycetota bacterium]|nr:ABC transporter permease subunit [Actinomycetota bacterium]